MVDIKALISIKDCSTYDVIHMTSKGYENETQYVVAQSQIGKTCCMR